MEFSTKIHCAVFRDCEKELAKLFYTCDERYNCKNVELMRPLGHENKYEFEGKSEGCSFFITVEINFHQSLLPMLCT
jgi:hypothetical protein